MCLCNDGYELAADGTTCIGKCMYSWSDDYRKQFQLLFLDIMECDTGLHDCQQLCINTVGSYECACTLGFSLTSNGTHCERKWLRIVG